MNLVAVFRCTLLVLFTIVLSGCFSANPEDVKAFLRPDQAQITGDDYILQPPDVVTILSSRVPELARSGSMSTVGMTQVIRPDGMITLESVGEIMVAGKTPRQVAEIIAQKLSELYKFTGDYPVDVRVTNQSKDYYIFFFFDRACCEIFTGRETTLSAIAKANPTVRAWEEAIQVIRPSLDLNERPKIFELDFKKMIEHGDMSKNVLLQEGDIIYVPPTILGSIGLTVEEIVGPLFQSATAARTLGVE